MYIFCCGLLDPSVSSPPTDLADSSSVFHAVSHRFSLDGQDTNKPVELFALPCWYETRLASDDNIYDTLDTLTPQVMGVYMATRDSAEDKTTPTHSGEEVHFLSNPQTDMHDHQQKLATHTCSSLKTRVRPGQSVQNQRRNSRQKHTMVRKSRSFT